ncbi:MAG: MFS transporter [Chloroflexota bacterium]|nr:MFS transporter [Chloroflexota bacterium]
MRRSHVPGLLPEAAGIEPQGVNPKGGWWRQPAVPLLGTNVLQGLGIQFFLPILPLYLHHRGLSNSLIGLTVAAGIAGFGGAQLPSGLLADRFNRRTIVILGTAIYGAFYFLYLLPLPPVWFPVIRFFHAASGGAYTPAALALLADLTPVDGRARIYGLWQSSYQSGLLVGPLIGGLVAALDLQVIFITSAVLCLLSAIPLFRLPSVKSVRGILTAQSNPHTSRGAILRRLLSTIGMASAGDYLTGAVTAVWTLLLISRGASTVVVGVAFTLFALPAVLLSAPAASYAARRGGKLLVSAALLACALTAVLSGLGPPLPVLLGLGFLLGLFSMPARPIAFYLGSRAIGSEQQGAAQSILQTGLFSVQVSAAIISGVLLGFGTSYVFLAVAAACVFSLVVLLRSPTIFAAEAIRS